MNTLSSISAAQHMVRIPAGQTWSQRRQNGQARGPAWSQGQSILQNDVPISGQIWLKFIFYLYLYQKKGGKRGKEEGRAGGGGGLLRKKGKIELPHFFELHSFSRA